MIPVVLLLVVGLFFGDHVAVSIRILEDDGISSLSYSVNWTSLRLTWLRIGYAPLQPVAMEALNGPLPAFPVLIPARCFQPLSLRPLNSRRR
jgi:hypothetical protein